LFDQAFYESDKKIPFSVLPVLALQTFKKSFSANKIGNFITLLWLTVGFSTFHNKKNSDRGTRTRDLQIHLPHVDLVALPLSVFYKWPVVPTRVQHKSLEDAL
jgi:hypothetical protein